MPDKMGSRLKVSIAVALGLVAAVLAAIIIIGIDIKRVAEEVVAVRQEVRTSIDQLGKLVSLREEAQRADPEFAVLEASIPERDELFSFPSRIDTIAAEHGVGARFSFGNEEQGRIGYSITAQGGYDALVSFVKALEEGIVFMGIEEVDVVIQEEGYNANIGGNVFFR